MNTEYDAELQSHIIEAIRLVDEMQRLTDEYLGHLPIIMTEEECEEYTRNKFAKLHKAT